MANTSLRKKIPPHATKNAGTGDRAQRAAAQQWAREYASAQGWPVPTVKLEHDGWQAYFSIPVDDV